MTHPVGRAFSSEPSQADRFDQAQIGDNEFRDIGVEDPDFQSRWFGFPSFAINQFPGVD